MQTVMHERSMLNFMPSGIIKLSDSEMLKQICRFIPIQFTILLTIIIIIIIMVKRETDGRFGNSPMSCSLRIVLQPVIPTNVQSECSISVVQSPSLFIPKHVVGGIYRGHGRGGALLGQLVGVMEEGQGVIFLFDLAGSVVRSDPQAVIKASWIGKVHLVVIED